MPGPEDLSLDLPGWKLKQRDASSVVWSDDAGDILGVYFYDLAPDIGAPLEQLDALRACYRQSVSGAGGAIVQVDVSSISDVSAVETVFKFPMQPTGMAYVGSFTVPFQSFSFVVKAQCAEHGITGMRDATVFAMVNPEIDESTGEAIGWMRDPYDPEHSAQLLSNQSDAPEWDEKFPDHPLSRCRRHLDAVRSAAVLSDAVKSSPPFTGPPAVKKRSWWPFGKR